MLRRKLGPPKSRRKFRSPWSELDYLCKKIHFWLYLRKDKASARRYLLRLQRVLGELPENDMAILREEGLALFHEVKDQICAAIKHRQREVQLIEMLHEDVNLRDYDDSMRASILGGRDLEGLKERQAILRKLQEI